MGIFDEAKDKAREAMADHPDQVDQGIDKAADQVDRRTGDKYDSQVDKGADLAQEQADKFAGGDSGDRRP